MAKKPKPIKKPSLDPSLTQADIEVLIAEIAERQSVIQRLVAQADESIARLQGDLARAIATPKEGIDARAAVVHLWAEANREVICKKGTKTAFLATGTIEWRDGRASVRISGEDEVIATLKRLGLAKFVRTKDEINKEAVLADPDSAQGIAGLTVVRGAETLAIKPNQTEIEPVELVRKVS